MCNALDMKVGARSRYRPHLWLVVVVELPTNEHPPDLLRARANSVEASISEESPSWIL